MVGPLIDDTNFKSLETGVAYNAAGMSVDLIKSSITGTPTKTDLTLTTGGSQDWVELGNGMYYIEITAAQNNTEGELQLVGVATGILPFISAKYQVVPTNVFNSLTAGSDNLQVDTIQLAGTTQDATDLADFAAAGYDPATNKVQGVVLVDTTTAVTNDVGVNEWNGVALGTTNPLPNAAAGAAGGLPTDSTGKTSFNDLDAAGVATATWNAATVTYGGAGTYGQAVEDILVDTGEIGTAGAGLTNLGGSSNNWNTTTPPTAAAIVNEWETQSQADPTGFHVNVKEINGDATAANNLASSALGIISGTAQTGTLSTTVMTSDLTGYANDELIGRVVVWTGGTAAGQASAITDYASASGTVTYNAITTAPANNDTFVIV